MKKSQLAFIDYLKKEKNYSIHTVSAYERDLIDFAGFILVNFEQENLEELNYNQIRNWIVFLMDGGLSPVSINRKIASLKAFSKGRD